MSYKSDLRDAEEQQKLQGHIAKNEKGLFVFMDNNFNQLITFPKFTQACEFRIKYSKRRF